MMLKYAEFLIV